MPAILQRALCYQPPSRNRCRHITSGRTGSQRRPLGDPLTEAITPRGINQPLVINMRDLSSGALLYEISPSVLSISLPAFASFKSRYRVCDSRRRSCALRLEHSPETRCLSGAELKVRSHFPPAASLRTIGSAAARMVVVSALDAGDGRAVRKPILQKTLMECTVPIRGDGL